MSADNDFLADGEQEDDFMTSETSTEEQMDDFIASDMSDDSDDEIIEMLEESERVEEETKGEWTKFLILAVIMLGTIGVVWLAIPVIFGQIVPAVMGKGIEREPTTEIQDSGEEVQEGTSEEVDGSASEEEATEGSEEASSESTDAETVTEEGTEAAESTETEESQEASENEESSEENSEEGSEPAVAIQATYTVKQGDTLGAISRLYGIPAQSIIDANDIINPDILQIGAELKIPEK